MSRGEQYMSRNNHRCGSWKAEVECRIRAILYIIPEQRIAIHTRETAEHTVHPSEAVPAKFVCFKAAFKVIAIEMELLVIGADSKGWISDLKITSPQQCYYWQALDKQGSGETGGACYIYIKKIVRLACWKLRMLHHDDHWRDVVFASRNTNTSMQGYLKINNEKRKRIKKMKLVTLVYGYPA